MSFKAFLELEAKIEPLTAAEILDAHGARGKDFHTLSSTQVSGLVDSARKHKYHKSKSAPGSRGRMFHKHLHRILGEEVLAESPVTGTRIVSKHGVGSVHHAEVRYNRDFEEYSVHHYKHGKHLGEGPVSYHGNDKEDAKNTAEHEVKRHNSVAESVVNEGKYSVGDTVHWKGMTGDTLAGVVHKVHQNHDEPKYQIKRHLDGRDAHKYHSELLHKPQVREEIVDEAKIGQPLKGHHYHTKSDAELHYIAKDAGAAAQAMKGHSPHSEAKYLDQMNDAHTVLHYRSKGGKRHVEKPFRDAAVTGNPRDFAKEETMTEGRPTSAHREPGFSGRVGEKVKINKPGSKHHGKVGTVTKVTGHSIGTNHVVDTGDTKFSWPDHELANEETIMDEAVKYKSLSVHTIAPFTHQIRGVTDSGEEKIIHHGLRKFETVKKLASLKKKHGLKEEVVVNEKITDNKEQLEKAIAAAERKAHAEPSSQASSYVEALKKVLRRINGRKNIKSTEVRFGIHKSVAEETSKHEPSHAEEGKIKRASRIKFKKKYDKQNESTTLVTELSKKVLSSYRTKAMGQIKAGKGPLKGKEEKRFNGVAKSIKEQEQFDLELDALYESDTAIHSQDDFIKHAHASGHHVRTILRGSNAHIHAKHMGSGKTHGLFDVKKEYGVYSTSPLHVDECFEDDELVLEKYEGMEHMSDAAHELSLHASNESDLHPHRKAIIHNLNKKRKKGIYEPEKARKLWKHHADAAAQHYHKAYGDKHQPWHKMFSTSDRKQVAHHMEKHYKTEMDLGNHD